MRKQLICLFTLLSILISAQPPDKFFTKFGGAGNDIGYGVKETYDRQYVVIGSSSSYGAGGVDAFMLLVDSMGQLKWQKTFGGAGTDVGKSILVNPVDSGFVFTGYTNSFGFGGYDVYVIRTDKNGSILWEKSFGGFDWDFGNDLVFSADGNLVVCGSTYSSGFGKRDGLVLKVNMINGQLLWQKQFGGAEDDEFKSVSTSAGSEFCLAGNTQSFGEINGDILLYKIDTKGDSLSSIIYGGPLYDGANDVIVFNNKDIIIAGGSNSFTNGKRDVFLLKYDSLGNMIWKKNYGQSGDDEECFAIVFSQSMSLQESVLIYTTLEAAAVNKKDIKTIYLNLNGDYFGGFNSGKFGFSGDDEAFDIAPTKNRGYVEIGYTTSFDAQNKDIFLVKQDSLLAEGTFSVVGISENDSQVDGIKLFPNPFREELSLEFPQYEKSTYCQVIVYDVMGNLIFSKLFPKDGSTDIIHISSMVWNTGVYSLCIKTDHKTFHTTIIKQ